MSKSDTIDGAMIHTLFGATRKQSLVVRSEKDFSSYLNFFLRVFFLFGVFRRWNSSISSVQKSDSRFSIFFLFSVLHWKIVRDDETSHHCHIHNSRARMVYDDGCDFHKIFHFDDFHQGYTPAFRCDFPPCRSPPKKREMTNQRGVWATKNFTTQPTCAWLRCW